jgi:hypothetical protein
MFFLFENRMLIMLGNDSSLAKDVLVSIRPSAPHYGKVTPACRKE